MSGEVKSSTRTQAIWIIILLGIVIFLLIIIITLVIYSKLKLNRLYDGLDQTYRLERSTNENTEEILKELDSNSFRTRY